MDQSKFNSLLFFLVTNGTMLTLTLNTNLDNKWRIYICGVAFTLTLIKSKTFEPKVLIPCKNIGLLKPPNELFGFRYLNEIKVENEHFNSATLSDK
jgi:hypothetical protein